MFLGKSPALALLPVSSGDGLAAGRLYLISDFVVFDNAVVIDHMALAVDCFHVLSFLPVQPIGQLLNLHFQIVSLSLHRTRTMMLSTLGCVNWYASIHFAMSLSGIAW